jgi:hypothetical protein
MIYLVLHRLSAHLMYTGVIKAFKERYDAESFIVFYEGDGTLDKGSCLIQAVEVLDSFQPL